MGSRFLIYACLFFTFKHGLAQTDTLSFANVAKANTYFYQALPYGSMGNFNPLTVLLNRGFEMMRITKSDLAYDAFHYNYRFQNIVDNLGSPIKHVKQYGAKDFFLEQLVPFGNPQKPYWYPNYTLHLIGGGITYTGLKEWYIQHHMPLPGIWSATTVLTAALINEAIEERERPGGFILNVDAVADFWIFDVGGILLFQSKKVNRFFSQTLNMRDWSRQPMLLFPGPYLGNCGQFFSFKPRIPGTQNWHFFSLMGLGGLVGVSHTFKNQYAWSIGFGQGPRRKEKELFGLPIDISLVPMAGIYLDRNNSVLASLELSNSKNDLYHNYFAELNIYPGLIHIGKRFSPGIWSAISKQQSWLFGVNCQYSFGLGVGRRP